jgi:hypothetical protein
MIIILLLFIICFYITKKEKFNNYLYLNNNNNIINPINYIQEDVVCLIAMWGRQELVQININLLQKQTKKCKILLVVSCEADKKFAMKNKNIDWIYTDNKPLGKKWQVGLNECKKYNPSAVLINGSDDLLSLNWVETCYKYIKSNNYDIVGKSNWYILDLIKKVPYKFKYTNVNILLGAGRMLSRNILDEINWELFPINQNRALDSYCNKILNYHKAKRLICNLNKLFVISLKGQYDTLNSIELILKTNKRINNIVIQPIYKPTLNNIILYINKYITSIATYKNCINKNNEEIDTENINEESLLYDNISDMNINNSDNIKDCVRKLQINKKKHYNNIEIYINKLQNIKK